MKLVFLKKKVNLFSFAGRHVHKLHFSFYHTRKKKERGKNVQFFFKYYFLINFLNTKKKVSNYSRGKKNVDAI